MHDSSICNLYYRINWCKVAFKVMLSWSTHSEIMNKVPEYWSNFYDSGICQYLFIIVPSTYSLARSKSRVLLGRSTAGILNRWACKNIQRGLQSGAYWRFKTYITCMQMQMAWRMWSALYSAPPKITSTAPSPRDAPTETICGCKLRFSNFSLRKSKRVLILCSMSPAVCIEKKRFLLKIYI